MNKKILQAVCTLPILMAMTIGCLGMNTETTHIFHLDHKDGLPSDYIRSINQDSRGFVWVATGDGLSRFEGHRFVTYTKENSGLQSNQVNDVIPDKTNPDRIWIATRNDGMAVFDYSTGKIEPRPEASNSPDIPGLSPASGGKIWITNYYLSPALLDPATGKANPIYDVLPNDLPTAFWCLTEVPTKGSLYVGHDGGGFSIIDLKTKEFKNFQHSGSNPESIGASRVYSIIAEKDGTAWLGTDRGVSIFNPKDETFVNVMPDSSPNGLLPGAVYDIKDMDNGDLWFAIAGGGVSVLPADCRNRKEPRFANLTPASIPGSSVSTSSIFTLFEDSFGNKWVGNFYGGIDVVSHTPSFFTIYEVKTPESGVPHERHKAVWSSAIDQDGNVWAGGDGEIIKITQSGTKTYRLPTFTGYRDQIKALCTDSKGILWLGTNMNGVFSFNPASETFRRLNLNVRDVRSVIEYNGAILVGTKTGIFRSDDGVAGYFDSVLSNAVDDVNIMSLQHDSFGNLWIGTFTQGAFMITPEGGVTHFNKGNGLKGNTINAFYEDNQGNMWTATREGASRIDRTTMMVNLSLGTSDGFLNSDVKAINGDSNGIIWFATNKGIVSYNPEASKVSVYRHTFGEELSSFTENSSVTDSHDRLYFGSLDGLVHFNATSEVTGHGDSKVVLSGIKANDGHADNHNVIVEIPVVGDRITLPHNMNTFTLLFSDPDITRAANSDYCYNMKGLNDIWTEVTHENEAIYRNLKPGDYEFQVRRRLNGGDWGEPATLARITINPPIYLTWWAKLAYIVVGAALVLAFMYSYKRKLILEQRLAIETENNKNSTMLHEERMIFFTNITHELRTPLSLIIAPIEDLVHDDNLNPSQRSKLLTIRTSSMRLLNLINGILEFRKTETRNRKLEVAYGNLSNFVREIGLRFKELNNNRNVEVSIDVAGSEEIFAYYDPDVIQTVINNLMSNSMKYTQAGEIALSLGVVEEKGIKYVELSVTDTGIGIPQEDLPHIFERYYQANQNKKISGTGIGLALTKNMVDLHEGEISVESAPQQGCRVAVRLLLDNTYPSAQHRETENTAAHDGHLESADSDNHDHKLRLLIVEDDPDVREYIRQSFADEFIVFDAVNGREGLEIVRQKMPDIVVSDIMMPEMDGIELCTAIKSDVSVSHIPVILLTAKDSLVEKEEGYASGADSYITKPFIASLLKARIINIIESRHKLAIRMFNMEFKDYVSGDDTDKEKAPEGKQPELLPIDRQFVDKFRKVVEENIDNADIDIPFMSDKMCMSHSTLYRKVKGMMGISPNELIRKIKIQKACQLLREGEVSVSELPYAAGFTNPTYFRKVFKKETGVSPTEYLSSLRSAPDK